MTKKNETVENGKTCLRAALVCAFMWGFVEGCWWLGRNYSTADLVNVLPSLRLVYFIFMTGAGVSLIIVGTYKDRKRGK